MITIKVDTMGVEAKIDKAEKKVEADIVNGLNKWAINTTNDAKINCPVDEGFLRNSISPVLAAPGNLKASVVVAANYAAYIEFGTRSFAASYVSTLPSNWQQYAATFKGSAGGGDFNDFIMRLVEWIKRKGIDVFHNEERGTIIDIESGNISGKRKRRTKSQREAKTEQVAYAIALKILVEGIKPHPFLFPAVQKNLLELEKRLKS